MNTESQEQVLPIIPESRQIEITNKFQEYKEIANEWKTKAFSIVVSDETQIELIQEAKKAKDFLGEKRRELEKTRKKLKEQSLEEGRLIDRFAKSLSELIEPAEKHLELQSKFIEIQEQKRRLELESERLEKIKPYIAFLDLNSFDLKTMSDVAFETILNGAMFAYQRDLEKQEEEKKKAEELILKNRVFEQRREELKSLWFFYYKDVDKPLTIDCSDEDFESLKKELLKRKENYEKEKAEAEAKAQKAKAEAEAQKAKAEAELKKVKEEAEAQKAKLEAEAQKAKAEAETQKAKAIADAEKVKAEAEAKAQKAREEVQNLKQKLEKAESNSQETKLSYDVLQKQNIVMKKALLDLNNFIIPDNARKIIEGTIKYLKSFE